MPGLRIRTTTRGWLSRRRAATKGDGIVLPTVSKTAYYTSYGSSAYCPFQAIPIHGSGGVRAVLVKAAEEQERQKTSTSGRRATLLSACWLGEENERCKQQRCQNSSQQSRRRRLKSRLAVHQSVSKQAAHRMISPGDTAVLSYFRTPGVAAPAACVACPACLAWAFFIASSLSSLIAA